MRILPPPVLTPQDIERFWSKVVKTDGCWDRGTCNNREGKISYAAFVVNGVTYKASAIAYFLEHGVYPSQWLLHTCDNPRCVRPSHLFEGTPKQNSQDMIRKGRGGQGRHKTLSRAA